MSKYHFAYYLPPTGSFLFNYNEDQIINRKDMLISKYVNEKINCPRLNFPKKN